MALLQLNVGLNVAGVERLDGMNVISALRSEFNPFIVGPCLYAFDRAASGERTITASMLVSPQAAGHYGHLIYKLSRALERDCIAGIYNGDGFLIGPKAAAWGDAFNAEFWVTPPAIDQVIIDMRELIDCYDQHIAACSDDDRHAIFKRVNAIRAKIQNNPMASIKY